MIESFRHKGLSLLFGDDNPSKVSPQYVTRLRLILSVLDAAQQIEDIDQPTFHLHPLKGELEGFWAVTVRSNWRVVFRFIDGCVSDVDLIDYH